MAQPRNWYSNIKLIFLILFLLMFIGYAIRDYRLGNSMVGPGIFGAFLLVIALVFKPWRQGSDEGTPPKKPPSGSAFLLAPLLVQDSTTADYEMCDGWISCHPVALTVFVALLILGFVGFRYARKREADRKAGRR